MIKGLRSLLVPLLALILVAPIAGVSTPFMFSESDLKSNALTDFPREDMYAVEIYHTNMDDSLKSLTRNEEIDIEFTIENKESSDDTYDLSVTWDDPEGIWFSQPEVSSIYVMGYAQKQTTFKFRAPVQYVDTDSSMTFTVKATSQNSSSVYDSTIQEIEIDMIYAVDVTLRDGDSNIAKRGEQTVYNVTLSNSGETEDTFYLEAGELPKDWNASASTGEIFLVPGESQEVYFTVTVPDTAAEDEYGLIDFIAKVGNDDYDYIYGFATTNTTTEDGLTYKVNITSDMYSKKVIPGGVILYDLSITNQGDETDTFILKVGNHSELGWSSNLSQDEILDLAPQDSTTVVLSIFAPDGAEEDVWSLVKVSVNSFSREQFGDDLIVNTSIRLPVRGVSLASQDDSLNGNPGSTLTYTMVVQNTGSDPDDILLGLEICELCNSWVVSLSKTLVENLEDGKSKEVNLFVQIPASARNTDSAVINVTAQSHDDLNAVDTISTVSTVNTIYQTSVTFTTVPIMYPEDANNFNLSVTNEGNSQQAYRFTEGTDVPEGWGFENTLPFETSVLGPYGDSALVTLPFEVPSDASPGYYNFSIYVKQISSGLRVATIDLSVQVEYYADFAIDVKPSDSTGNPGFTHKLAVSLTNNANADDEIHLSVNNLPTGWTYCVLFNGNCLNSLIISKGGMSEFILEIKTLDNEPANTINGVLLSLVGTSSLNDKAVSEDSFKIYTNPTYLLEVSSPDTNKTGDSGDTIPFQLTITNSGNDVDYVSLASPALPNGWVATYTESSFTLSASESKIVYLNVKIPDNVLGGDNTIAVTVSSDQSSQSETVILTVSVDQKADIDLELKTTAGDVKAGTIGTFRVLITNNGNTLETLTLSIEGKRASWFTLPKETLTLQPGDYEEILVEVMPPVMQPASDTSGTLNVTLSSDNSKSIMLSLPFAVLKSDLIQETAEVDEEEGLPSLSLISTVLIITFISFIRRIKL